MRKQVLVEQAGSLNDVAGIESLLPVRALETVNGASKLIVWVCKLFLLGLIYLVGILLHHASQSLVIGSGALRPIGNVRLLL